MKRAILTSFCLTALCISNVARAQVTLNPIPVRVLGHPRLALTTGNPNLVEGRELFGPQGIAIDKTANPPILYVADTSNHRVLAWRNARQFANGATADIVVGQKDLYSTFTLGPGTALSGGLRLPTGLAVDNGGNLFVADSGNNRILRFPKPFSQPDVVKAPDLVLGQPSLVSRDVNAGGRSAKSLWLNVSVGNRFVAAGLAFDAVGNLFASDPGNNRVLRYPAAAVAPGATASGPDADIVLGQAAFTLDPQSPSGPTDLRYLAAPSGIALDEGGRLYVADAYVRVVVFTALSTGSAAQRLIGGVYNSQRQPLEPPTERSLDTPEGVFVVGSTPFVIDSGNNRILRFDPYSQWPADPKVTPPARAWIGQETLYDYKPNRGSSLAQAGSLHGPVAAAYFDGELYVADSLNHRVIVGPDPVTASNWAATRVAGQPFLDSDSVNRVEGREFYFGVPGVVGGGGVAVDRKSDPPHLYVADAMNNRVLCFRDLRKVRPGDKADLVLGQPGFERTIVNYPSGQTDQPQKSNLFRPSGVAVDSAGNVYVADTGNGRVLRFQNPFQAGINMPDADLVLGKPSFTTPAIAVPDPSTANMGGPYGLAFAVEGHLLVSDIAYNRVLLFRKQAGGDFANGQAAGSVFGQPDFNSRTAGNLEAQMNSPRHIAADTDDRLYVCDTGNSRVVIYGRTTAAPSSGASPVMPPLFGFYNPMGIHVSAATGELWVADSNNRRLLRYPRFDVLILNPQPEVTVSSGSTDEAPIAVTLDNFGNMITAYSTNRVAFYFSAMTHVNAANYLPRIAPGMIVSLFPLPGATFGEQTQVFSGIPLPTDLADIQVLVDDVPAPLYFVSPGQINFLMPMSAPTSGTVEIQVVRKSNGEVLGVGCSIERNGNTSVRRNVCVGQVQMSPASPAFYAGTAGVDYGLGAGAVAALNRKWSDGSYYGINTPANPVARGDIIEMYGTGQGFIPNAPPDGSPATGAVPTPDAPRVIVGTRDAEVLYSGLAPGNVGLWQIDVKISSLVNPAPAVPVAIVHNEIPSTNPPCITAPNPPCQTALTTISVKQ